MTRHYEYQRQQRALAVGVQLLDASARRQSEEAAFGVMRQYDLILGFMEHIEPLVRNYAELYTFYFPVASLHLLCVYRTPDQPQPIPVEFRQLPAEVPPLSTVADQYSYQTEARQRAREIFAQTLNEPFYSFEHPPLIKHSFATIHSNHQGNRHPVLQLLLAALDGVLPRSYPNGSASLVVCCPVPEQAALASDRMSNLSGILVLFGDKQSFPQATHAELAKKLKNAFNKYLAGVGQFAVRELEFFLTSLLNQDERIHDNQNRALGFVAHMVAHRFRNYRQVAGFIAQEFPTAAAVAQRPDLYQRQIQAMQNHLHRGERLEKQLFFIGQMPQNIVLTVSELVDIFNYVFHQAIEQVEESIQLDIRIPHPLLKETVRAAPPPILEEVFHNHIENIVRVLAMPEVSHKHIYVQAYSEANYISLTLTHYGPPLTPDVLEDLQRVVRVRHPNGSGLGMFLSAMIMRHIGGHQVVDSPAPDHNIGVCATLKFAHLK